MDLLIKNGTLVFSKEMIKADIAVKGGVISSIGTDIDTRDALCVVNGEGCLVLPGAIDAHTHLAMPFAGTVSADDYYTGTKAAACGGTTTVFDFAGQEKGETFPDCFRRRNDICRRDVCVDYAFHLGVTDISGDILDSIKECISLGVSSFKAYMTYDFSLDDGELAELLEKSKEFGGLVAVHAENKAIIARNISRFLAEGNTDAWHHYLSRPEFVEAEAVSRAILIAKSQNAPLYIVHLSSKEGMELVTQARDCGMPLFAETCPQYLNFTCDVYKEANGRNFVCSPPIKGKASQDALWNGIRRGDIATIATDHCPVQEFEKDWGKDNFTKIPNGCPGIENMYPYMLSQANNGVITFCRAVELCSENVAKLFGCDKKGSLSAGKDADIVIYDPNIDFVIENKKMHGANDYTIWEGVKLKGYPKEVYSRGNLVFKDGEFTGRRGGGKFVRCNPIRLSGPYL